MTVLIPAPPASSPRIRAVMRGNRRRDTGPERRLRSRLHALGLRYRVDFNVKCGGRNIRVDIAFTRRRVAVFVDGCFWHGCDRHPKSPKSNLDYWTPKIEGNRARDVANTRILEQAGWVVVRGWEHEPPEEMAERVVSAAADAPATPPAVARGEVATAGRPRPALPRPARA